MKTRIGRVRPGIPGLIPVATPVILVGTRGATRGDILALTPVATPAGLQIRAIMRLIQRK